MVADQALQRTWMLETMIKVSVSNQCSNFNISDDDNDAEYGENGKS